MTIHLSSEEITAWALGERPFFALRHASECTQCQAEVARLEETLLSLRTSVRDWSAEEAASLELLPLPDCRRVAWSFSLTCATAMLAIVSCMLLWFTPAKPDKRISDAALLEQIHQEMAQTVPGPMQPLAGLISVDGSESSTAIIPATHPGQKGAAE